MIPPASLPTALAETQHDDSSASVADDPNSAAWFADQSTSAGPGPGISDASATDLAHAPWLAWLGAVAAFADLLMNRIGVHSVAQLSTHGRALNLAEWGRLPLHALGLAGLAVAYYGILRYLRMAGHCGMLRRLALALCAGVFLPAMAVCVFYKRERIHGIVVVILLLSGYTLATLLAGNALHFRAGSASGVSSVTPNKAPIPQEGARERRFAFAFWLSTTLALLLLLLDTFSARWASLSPARWQAWMTWFHVCLRVAAEFCWLIVPLIAIPLYQHAQSAQSSSHVERKRERVQRLWHAIISARAGMLAIAFAIALVSAGTYLTWSLRPHAARAVYAGFRIVVLSEKFSAFYLAWFAFNLAIAFGLCAHTHVIKRQFGLGLMFWCCAGFSPHTPVGMLAAVVGALLITRSTQESTQRGREQAVHPWR